MRYQLHHHLETTNMQRTSFKIDVGDGATCSKFSEQVLMLYLDRKPSLQYMLIGLLLLNRQVKKFLTLKTLKYVKSLHLSSHIIYIKEL